MDGGSCQLTFEVESDVGMTLAVLVAGHHLVLAAIFGLDVGYLQRHRVGVVFCRNPVLVPSVLFHYLALVVPGEDVEGGARIGMCEKTVLSRNLYSEHATRYHLINSSGTNYSDEEAFVKCPSKALLCSLH